jgi:protein-disulfide isomerase
MSSEGTPDTTTSRADTDAPVPGSSIEVPRRSSADTRAGVAPSGGRPLWTAFLTPVAILVGSLVVGGAILIANGSGIGSAGAAGAASPGVAAAASSTAPVPSPAASSQRTAADLLAGYAGELGLDLAAFSSCLADPAMEKAVLDQQSRGSSAGVTGTPTTFVNDKKIVGAQPASVFDEVITAELADSPTTLDGYSAAVKSLAAMTPPRFEITGKRPDLTGATVDGPAGAPVVVAEFSDYACPFCQRWQDENGARILSAWPGRVAFAYVDFPLDGLHPNALAASVAASCAGKQDHFWQMHDLLFERQADWAGAPGG